MDPTTIPARIPAINAPMSLALARQGFRATSAPNPIS